MNIEREKKYLLIPLLSLPQPNRKQKCEFSYFCGYCFASLIKCSIAYESLYTSIISC